MFQAPNNNSVESDEVLELKRQLHRLSNAIAEFEAMAAELKLRPTDARVTGMLRLNRETIVAIQRSAELIEERLKNAEARAKM